MKKLKFMAFFAMLFGFLATACNEDNLVLNGGDDDEDDIIIEPVTPPPSNDNTITYDSISN